MQNEHAHEPLQYKRARTHVRTWKRKRQALPTHLKVNFAEVSMVLSVVIVTGASVECSHCTRCIVDHARHLEMGQQAIGEDHGHCLVTSITGCVVSCSDHQQQQLQQFPQSLNAATLDTMARVKVEEEALRRSCCHSNSIRHTHPIRHITSWVVVDAVPGCLVLCLTWYMPYRCIPSLVVKRRPLLPSWEARQTENGCRVIWMGPSHHVCVNALVCNWPHAATDQADSHCPNIS